MKHIDENTLERFVLQPGRLDKELVHSIGEHLSQCRTCSETLEFLTSVHSDLNSLDYHNQNRIDGFVRALFRTSNVIPLVPFKPRLDLNAFDGKYTTVLAAMTKPVDQSRFHTLGTFASQTENAVLRVTHDRQAQALRLYVHSEDPRASAYSIISTPELSTDFVTDVHGHLTIAATETLLNADWNSLKPVLHLKVAEYPLSVATLRTATRDHPLVIKSDPAVVLEAWIINGELVFQVETSGSGFSRAVVEYSIDKKVLVNMVNGTGKCAFDTSVDKVVIRFYH